MKKIIYIGLLVCIITANSELYSQEDNLEQMLENEMGPTTDKAMATFLSTFVLNNPSVELLDKNGINFRISHKFGFLNSGSENFYGFDYSSAFMGIEYAPIKGVNIGIGRGTFRSSVNSQLKISLLKQSTGSVNIPVTVVFAGEIDYRTQKYPNSDLQNDKAGRIEYTSQLLIARKFGNLFSLQLMPTFIHRNLVETKEDINDIAAFGIGGTLRLQKVLRLNAEYFWVQKHNTPTAKYFSPAAVGICYQTSRHSFELFASNSTGITSNNHIAFTSGDISKKDIGIGFNISIIFSVK